MGIINIYTGIFFGSKNRSIYRQQDSAKAFSKIRGCISPAGGDKTAIAAEMSFYFEKITALCKFCRYKIIKRMGNKYRKFLLKIGLHSW